MTNRTEQPYVPPTAPRRNHRNLALLLVGAGVLILLHNSDVFSGALWSVLVPMLMIAGGFDLVTNGMQRRRIVIGSLIATAILVPLVAGSQLIDRGGPPLLARRTSPVATVEDIARVRGTIDVVAGDLSIHALDDESDQVYEIDAPPEGVEYRRDDQTGVLDIQQRPWRSDHANLYLTRYVPLDLNVKVSGGNAKPLDFSDLELESLAVEVIGGSTAVALPEHGTMNVTLMNRGGNAEISVPEDLAARIEVQSFGGNVEVNNDRFVAQDNNSYITEDYSEDSPDRVTISINVTGGNVTIN